MRVIVMQLTGEPVSGGFRMQCSHCGMDRVAPHETETHYCGAPRRDGVLGRAQRAVTPSPTHGPGTELKKLLKKVGITATPNCSCNARARRMDEEEARHPGWCEEHLEEIVGWLREEATKRKLPFIDAAGRMLVRRAIKNAQRAKASA